jgi:hypothetical protein
VTPATFVPDPDWLDALIALEEKEAELDPGRSTGGLRAFASEFAAKVREGATSSELLGPMAVAFAKLYDHRDGYFLGQAPADFDPSVLRGDNPEFRPSARFALLAAFPEPSDLQTLNEIAWSLLPAQPIDLAPGGLATTAPRSVVSQVVDYVDRSRRLGQLLAEAQRARPAAEPLALVAETFARWQKIFEQCMAPPAAAPPEADRQFVR